MTIIIGYNRPYLYVKVFDEKIKGLLDSGAQASVMNVIMYESMKEEGVNLNECNVAISTADGTTHKALGYVNVPHVVKNIKRTIPTLVVEQAAVRLILGMDFWNAFRIKPCFISNTYGIRVIDGKEQVLSDPNENNGPIDVQAEITPRNALTWSCLTS